MTAEVLKIASGFLTAFEISRVTDLGGNWIQSAVSQGHPLKNWLSQKRLYMN